MNRATTTGYGIRLLRNAAPLLLLLTPALAGAVERSTSYVAAMASIHDSELISHVDYLADDRLKGREPGHRGGRQAGDYLAQQFHQCGLQGAGDDGGYFQNFAPNYRNVLAILRGSDPELARELVIVGAHYDHVGYGSKKTSRGEIGFIHNGADDNASGTAAVVELAEAFTMLPVAPRRSVLFACFDAEEIGLYGSKHWVAKPNVALANVAAMVNLDMVGRLRDDRLIVFGTRTGYGLRRLVSLQNVDPGLVLDLSWDLKRNADHYIFYEQRVPVLFFHTGLHDDYHTPDDDADRINTAGMGRVTRLVFGTAYELAEAAERPRFRPEAGSEHQGLRGRALRKRPKLTDRLGVAWRTNDLSGDGVTLSRVQRGSAAERAGLVPGDRVIQFAGRNIRNGEDLRAAVMTARNPASLYVRREQHDEPLQLSVRLDGEPLRLGVTWRVDAADPGGMILTRVIPHTPAAEAGLKRGDHIYRIAGRALADEAEFVRLVRSLPGPLEIVLERDGRLLTLVVELDEPPVAKAA